MASESLTDLFYSGLGLGQNVALEGHEAQGRSFVLSSVAQHVVEGVLNHLGVVSVAGFVRQNPGEGCDGVCALGGGVGVLASQVLVQADAIEGLGTRSHRGLEELTGLVLESGGNHLALDVRLVHITDRAFTVLDQASHTGVALGANASGPLHGFTGAEGPGLGEGLHGVGEGLGGARAIGTVHPGEGAGLAAELLPVLDHAHGDLDGLLLGELQVATGLVVTEGDGATHHRDLNHTTGDLGHVLLLHRIIRCTEVHGLVDEGFTAGTGTHGLVVDLRAASLGQVGEPTLVDLGREGGASGVQPGSRK